MANTVVISRTALIYGICLPLAVLLGYLLAEPFESGSIAVVVLVLSVLSVPLMMRWHHVFLIFSCNAAVYPFFVPGRPTLWMIAAVMSFFFLALNRSMGQDVRFFRARNVSMSLLFIGAVVFITAYFSGGIGFAALGNKNAGGKRYLGVFIGIMLYFALSTIPIKRKYANLAVAVFFLSTLTVFVGYIAVFGGPAFYFLAELFPVEGTLIEGAQTNPDAIATGIVRLGELSIVATGIFCFLMARYGVRGMLDLTKPWRMGMLLLTGVGNLYSGFRSSIILLLLTFFLMFYMEGLFRTRYFLSLMMTAVLGAAIMVPFSQKMPLVVQRTLCFLPITVDPVVRANADDSTDWRLEMWREVVPTVPRYLLKGKGFTMNSEDSFLIEEGVKRGFAKGYEGAMLAGDYHSGPLSLIIPFGLVGVGAFIWFLAASLKALRLNYNFGDPTLRNINGFMLAYFIARIISFIFVFGSFYSDLSFFASLIGLSVSLNGGVAEPPKPLSESEPE